MEKQNNSNRITTNGKYEKWITKVESGGIILHRRKIKKPVYKFTLKSFLEDDDYNEKLCDMENDNYMEPLHHAFFNRYKKDGDGGWLNDEDFYERIWERFNNRVGEKGWFKDRYGETWSWNPYNVMKHDFTLCWRAHIKGKYFYNKQDAWDKILDMWFMD